MGRLPVWPPLGSGFVAFGSLFAWSAWKLSVALFEPGGYTAPEPLPLAVDEHVAAMGAGAVWRAASA
ncbi:hypothetical protein [Embleya sp. NPDC020630]|uniref:hypothetical protein n=1 Tax=Embleya sp. NPDC020630 TaxID=3363979 RepID=UPI0037A34380